MGLNVLRMEKCKRSIYVLLYTDGKYLYVSIVHVGES